MTVTKFTTLSLEQYLHELSSEKSIPGGGSVSAYVASMGMGLIQMVGRITLSRKKKKELTPEEDRKDNERRATIQKIIDSLEKTKRDAFQIVNVDPEVYQEVMDVWSDPKKREDALENSFRLQADLTFLVVMAYEWNQSMADLVSGSIKNDLIVSSGLLEAAFKGAYHTALINIHYMTDAGKQQHAENALKELKERFEKGKGSAS